MRGLVLIALAALAATACDDERSGRHERAEPIRDPDRRDKMARGYERDYKDDMETVRAHRAWQARIRTLDLAAMGLPPVGETDDAFRPVTGDASFCVRLPEQETPAPEVLVTEYRRHARDYQAVALPEDFDGYRTHYLAERQLARLACLARAGETAHRSAFVELLDDDEPAVRYTTAIHAINHDLAPEAGRATLRGLADGEWQYFQHAAHVALSAEQTPLGMYFDPNYRLDRAKDRLRGHQRRRTRPRNRGEFRF